MRLKRSPRHVKLHATQHLQVYGNSRDHLWAMQSCLHMRRTELLEPVTFRVDKRHYQPPQYYRHVRSMRKTDAATQCPYWNYRDHRLVRSPVPRRRDDGGGQIILRRELIPGTVPHSGPNHSNSPESPNNNRENQRPSALRAPLKLPPVAQRGSSRVSIDE